MKKFIYLLITLVPFLISAQENSDYYDKYVNSKTNYAIYTGTATDTINGVATADAVFYIEQAVKSRYTFSFMLDGDTLAGSTGDCTIQPQGSYDGVTYSNIGSSTAWTSSTAEYLANVSANTYTTLASGTLTNAQHTRNTAAFDVVQDTTGMATYFADTTSYPAQTQTVEAQIYTDARTVTVTLPGVDYNYLKTLVTGASGARVEIQLVAIKVTPIFAF